MEFRDRITSLPEEKKELVDIWITLYSDKTIWLSLKPKGWDIQDSWDAMVKFLLEDYILTGIAMVKEIWRWDVEDGVKMVDSLMELWGRHTAWWNDLSHKEKIEILSKDDDENVDEWETDWTTD